MIDTAFISCTVSKLTLCVYIWFQLCWFIPYHNNAIDENIALEAKIKNQMGRLDALAMAVGGLNSFLLMFLSGIVAMRSFCLLFSSKAQSNNIWWYILWTICSHIVGALSYEGFNLYYHGVSEPVIYILQVLLTTARISIFLKLINVDAPMEDKTSKVKRKLDIYDRISDLMDNLGIFFCYVIMIGPYSMLTCLFYYETTTVIVDYFIKSIL
jgi:hypothetical protein